MKIRGDIVISTALHAALLVWCALSFSVIPRTAAQDSLPIDIISDKQFSELTAGMRNAPKPEVPKPVVDKVEEPKPKETLDAVSPVVEKTEVKPIPRETPPEQAQPEKKPEAKPEKAEKPKPDPIAEALKKEEARKQAEEKAKAKAEAAKKKQPAFNPDK